MDNKGDRAMTIKIAVEWQTRWYSRYLKGRIVGGDIGRIFSVYKHDTSRALRVYSKGAGWPLNGEAIQCNSETPVTVHRSGRWGRLHIGRP